MNELAAKRHDNDTATKPTEPVLELTLFKKRNIQPDEIVQILMSA